MQNLYLFLPIQMFENISREFLSTIILITFVLFVILLLLLFKLYADRRKAVKEGYAKEKDLETAQRKLLEGIGYAERMQTAILPSPGKLRDIFSQSFVIFRPKMDVGGDFYWVEKRGAKKMFGVIDCTGHGVPGVLMSIIAYDGLNRAIIDYELTRADKIVSALNEYMTEALKQTGSIDIKDGMNLALCVYNEEKSLLEYTGAHNSIYLMRNTEEKLYADKQEIPVRAEKEGSFLYELKADRKSVEPSETAMEFTNHRISVQKGDSIYLFTDGIVDQFGGPEEKKYGYNRFRDMLFEVQGMKMQDQKRKIDESFMGWKSNTEQLDDMTLLGIKI